MKQFICLCILTLSFSLSAQIELDFHIDSVLQTEIENLLSTDEHQHDLMIPGFRKISPENQILFRDDNEELIDSSYCYDYDAPTDTWSVYGRRYYKYDEENRPISLILQSWDENEHSWLNLLRSLTRYFTANLQSEYTFQQWDTDSQSWINTQRLTYKYNENNLQSEYYNQEWNTASKVWVNIRRQTYEYNESNDQILFQASDWDDMLGQWYYRYQTEYTYDENGVLLLQISSRPSGSNSWYPYRRIEYLNEDDRVIESIDIKWYSSSGWVPQEKIQYSYNDTLISQKLHQNWRTNSNMWLNVKRYRYQYNENDLLKEYTLEKWYERWINEERTTHEYNVDNQLAETANYSWNSEKEIWMGDSRFINIYDENGEISNLYYQYDTPSAYDTIHSYQYLYSYDENDSLILWTELTWNDSLKTWENVYHTELEYDALGNQILDIDREWVDSIQSWVTTDEEYHTYSLNNFLLEYRSNNFRTVYIYDGEWRLIETIDMTYEPDSNAWINTYRILNSYDSIGLLARRQYQAWDDDWVNISQYFNTYNKHGLITESLYQNWSGEWIKSGRALFNYNKKGLRIEYLTQDWQDMWVNKLRQLYTYDNENRLIYEDEAEWSSSDLSWNVTRDHVWDYNADGKLIKDFYINTSPYGFSGRGHLWVYDGEGRLLEDTTFTSFNWDFENIEWHYYHRYTYHYNEGPEPDVIYFYEWDGFNSRWRNIERAIYKYVPQGNTTIVKQFQNVVDLWVNKSVSVLLVDENENPIAFTFSAITASEYIWIDVSRCDYFLSEHTTALLNLESEQLECRYPNPFLTGASSIVCESTQSIDQFQIDVLDVTGKRVFSKIGTSGAPVQLEGTFPQGSYILIVHDRGKILHRNKLMIFD